MGKYQIVQVKRKDQFDLKSLFRDSLQWHPVRLGIYKAHLQEGRRSIPVQEKDWPYNHHHHRKKR